MRLIAPLSVELFLAAAVASHTVSTSDVFPMPLNLCVSFNWPTPVLLSPAGAPSRHFVLFAEGEF